MSDLIRKAFLAGLGAVWVSKERTQKLLKELAQKGEAAKEEEAWLKELLARADEVRATAEERLGEVLSRMNLATSSQVAELSRKVDELSQRLRG
jgi:polyhydroxyalkanoate synthesis regulator phasin